MPLIGLAYLGFISLGLPDGLLGVAWPSMRSQFGVPLGSVGYLIAAGTTGYVLSSVTAGFLLSRLGVGVLLAGSTVLSGSGLAGLAISPAIPFAAAAVLLVGLGSGAIDSGLNAYAAGNFGARHMNWLHAAFGFGAMLGPLVMTAAVTSTLTWRGGYASAAGLLALLAMAFAASARLWNRGRPQQATSQRKQVRGTFRIPAVWLGVAMFGVYTALEIAAGLWAYTFLTGSRGLAPAAAGLCVSAYWGGLFAGRLLLGVLGDRIPPARLVWLGLIGIGVGVALLVPPYAVTSIIGLVVTSFAAAPVFPMLTLITSQRVGADHADRAVGLQMGSAGLFGTIIPAGVGVLIGRQGAGVLGPCLAILAVALLCLYAADRNHVGAVTARATVRTG